jgi:hypothetical protein
MGVDLPDIEAFPENHVAPLSRMSTEVRDSLLSVNSIVVGEA